MAYFPHGTSGAQSTTFRSGLARSATPVIPFGLPGATMIWSRFVAKTTGSVPLRLAAVSLSMFAVSAEAKTSAGAPWVICCTSADDAS